ncbi:hypothetical protein VTJ04DRAFT_7700 [Mycothermus thermophilus]|uniref:uncharacterized protein n=1 Tax=Humicola insolens TaxID=85995 RepID=UPI003741EAA3
MQTCSQRRAGRVTWELTSGQLPMTKRRDDFSTTTITFRITTTITTTTYPSIVICHHIGVPFTFGGMTTSNMHTRRFTTMLSHLPTVSWTDSPRYFHRICILPKDSKGRNLEIKHVHTRHAC